MSRDIIREEARLIILRELLAQGNYSLSDSLLRDTLEAYGISKSRDWVREEMAFLKEVDAIDMTAVGSVVVATLRPKGMEHAERRYVIAGVKRPSPPRE